jgi:hypothetical protein
MPQFAIPEDLSVFAVDGLRDLRRVASDELTALRAANSPETISDDDLARGEALAAFIASADTEMSGRQARADRFGALGTTEPEPAPEPEPVPEPAPTASTEPEPAPEPAPAPEPTASAEPVPAPQRVGVSDLADGSTHPDAAPESAFGQHVVIAGADIDGVGAGTQLGSWLEIAQAFCNRTRGYSGRTPTQHTVATIRREFGPEFTFDAQESRNPELVAQKLRFVTDESRLEGGSLIAANGWCSPSENLYSTCNQISADGLVSLPEVSAPRGGINHNQGIEFDTVFGDGTGYNILTEDDVISGVEKTCLEIPCPPFVDDRLKVAALCLTGSILQNRAYPEFVSEFVQGAVAVQAHNVNRQIIADLVAGSTAVDLTASAPWASDSSVISQTLSAVEHAILDIKYRLRLPRNATLEVILPYWIIAQYRADMSRRNASQTEAGLADATLAAWFSMRGARPQYVYDWQDSFADAGVGFGADSALLTTPFSVDFLIYPAGTWVLARLDVIRLDSIYDSVNLPQNMVTQLFQEDGFAVMRMCPQSGARMYTVPICPSGATSDLQTIACPS